jgi:hypothetical protein
MWCVFHLPLWIKLFSETCSTKYIGDVFTYFSKTSNINDILGMKAVSK